MRVSLSTFALLATSFLGFVMADDCEMSPIDYGVQDGDTNANIGDIIDNDAICLPQGEGDYTFAMVVSSSSLGFPGTQVSKTVCMIMDNGCKLLGSYIRPSCGIPWHIKDDFLDYDLIIEGVFADVGDPYYEFAYGDGLYSIRNNHCVCNDAGGGSIVLTGCRCAFPVDGHYGD